MGTVSRASAGKNFMVRMRPLAVLLVILLVMGSVVGVLITRSLFANSLRQRFIASDVEFSAWSFGKGQTILFKNFLVRWSGFELTADEMSIPFKVLPWNKGHSTGGATGGLANAELRAAKLSLNGHELAFTPALTVTAPNNHHSSAWKMTTVARVLGQENCTLDILWGGGNNGRKAALSIGGHQAHLKLKAEIAKEPKTGEIQLVKGTLALQAWLQKLHKRGRQTPPPLADSAAPLAPAKTTISTADANQTRKQTGFIPNFQVKGAFSVADMLLTATALTADIPGHSFSGALVGDFRAKRPDIRVDMAIPRLLLDKQTPDSLAFNVRDVADISAFMSTMPELRIRLVAEQLKLPGAAFDSSEIFLLSGRRENDNSTSVEIKARQMQTAFFRLVNAPLAKLSFNFDQQKLAFSLQGRHPDDRLVLDVQARNPACFVFGQCNGDSQVSYMLDTQNLKAKGALVSNRQSRFSQWQSNIEARHAQNFINNWIQPKAIKPYNRFVTSADSFDVSFTGTSKKTGYSNTFMEVNSKNSFAKLEVHTQKTKSRPSRLWFEAQLGEKTNTGLAKSNLQDILALWPFTNDLKNMSRNWDSVGGHFEYLPYPEKHTVIIGPYEFWVNGQPDKLKVQARAKTENSGFVAAQMVRKYIDKTLCQHKNTQTGTKSESCVDTVLVNIDVDNLGLNILPNETSDRFDVSGHGMLSGHLKTGFLADMSPDSFSGEGEFKLTEGQMRIRKNDGTIAGLDGPQISQPFNHIALNFADRQGHLSVLSQQNGAPGHSVDVGFAYVDETTPPDKYNLPVLWRVDKAPSGVEPAANNNIAKAAPLPQTVQQLQSRAHVVVDGTHHAANGNKTRVAGRIGLSTGHLTYSFDPLAFKNWGASDSNEFIQLSGKMGGYGRFYWDNKNWTAENQLELPSTKLDWRNNEYIIKDKLDVWTSFSGQNGQTAFLVDGRYDNAQKFYLEGKINKNNWTALFSLGSFGLTDFAGLQARDLGLHGKATIKGTVRGTGSSQDVWFTLAPEDASFGHPYFEDWPLFIGGTVGSLQLVDSKVAGFDMQTVLGHVPLNLAGQRLKDSYMIDLSLLEPVELLAVRRMLPINVSDTFWRRFLMRQLEEGQLAQFRATKKCPLDILPCLTNATPLAGVTGQGRIENGVLKLESEKFNVMMPPVALNLGDNKMTLSLEAGQPGGKVKASTERKHHVEELFFELAHSGKSTLFETRGKLGLDLGHLFENYTANSLSGQQNYFDAKLSPRNRIELVFDGNGILGQKWKSQATVHKAVLEGARLIKPFADNIKEIEAKLTYDKQTGQPAQFALENLVLKGQKTTLDISGQRKFEPTGVRSMFSAHYKGSLHILRPVLDVLDPSARMTTGRGEVDMAYTETPLNIVEADQPIKSADLTKPRTRHNMRIDVDFGDISFVTDVPYFGALVAKRNNDRFIASLETELDDCPCQQMPDFSVLPLNMRFDMPKIQGTAHYEKARLQNFQATVTDLAWLKDRLTTQHTLPSSGQAQIDMTCKKAEGCTGNIDIEQATISTGLATIDGTIDYNNGKFSPELVVANWQGVEGCDYAIKGHVREIPGFDSQFDLSFAPAHSDVAKLCTKESATAQFMALFSPRDSRSLLDIFNIYPRAQGQFDFADVVTGNSLHQLTWTGKYNRKKDKGEFFATANHAGKNDKARAVRMVLDIYEDSASGEAPRMKMDVAADNTSFASVAHVLPFLEQYDGKITSADFDIGAPWPLEPSQTDVTGRVSFQNATTQAGLMSFIYRLPGFNHGKPAPVNGYVSFAVDNNQLSIDPFVFQALQTAAGTATVFLPEKNSYKKNGFTNSASTKGLYAVLPQANTSQTQNNGSDDFAVSARNVLVATSRIANSFAGVQKCKLVLKDGTQDICYQKLQSYETQLLKSSVDLAVRQLTENFENMAGSSAIPLPAYRDGTRPVFAGATKSKPQDKAVDKPADAPAVQANNKARTVTKQPAAETTPAQAPDLADKNKAKAEAKSKAEAQAKAQAEAQAKAQAQAEAEIETETEVSTSSEESEKSKQSTEAKKKKPAPVIIPRRAPR